MDDANNYHRDTGEHISNEKNELQYIPFPTCNETGLPLELHYGVESELNCTIPFITDPFFHLLEFYIHNDAPLSCRLPAHSPAVAARKSALESISADAKGNAVLGLGTESGGFVPLTVALAGTLQRSHLHVANWLNVVVHTAAAAEESKKATKVKAKAGKKALAGAIDSASAYSISPATRNTRVIIGDSLTFVFSVRWYDSTELPLVQSAQKSSGGGGFTFVACLFSAAVSAGLVYLWLRGVDVPRGMRVGGVERLGRRETGLPKYNGYGYGIGGGQMNGADGGTGKRD
jgi:hypothetical protein